MKVLVTGGTGFIGSRLIERLLQARREVVCVARDTMHMSFLQRHNVTCHIGDLSGRLPWHRLLADVDCVYHLAGVTRARRARDYYEGNTLGTRHLVRQCVEHCPNLSRFVFVSSLAASGPTVNDRPLHEDAPYHPVSHYGKSKMMAEAEVLKAADRLPVVVVRPAAVYGPREVDMYDLFRMILGGLQPVVGYRRKLMSLVHVDDLVRGLIAAQEHETAVGQVFFLGSESYYSIEEIGATIAEVVHKHPIRLHVPHMLVYAIGAAMSAIGWLAHKQVFFNLQKAREATQAAWICSVAKACELLGFRQEIPLQDGVRMTYDWYLAHGWL